MSIVMVNITVAGEKPGGAACLGLRTRPGRWRRGPRLRRACFRPAAVQHASTCSARIDETAVDHTAEAMLCLLGIPAPEAARLAALLATAPGRRQPRPRRHWHSLQHGSCHGRCWRRDRQTPGARERRNPRAPREGVRRAGGRVSRRRARRWPGGPRIPWACAHTGWP